MFDHRSQPASRGLACLLAVVIACSPPAEQAGTSGSAKLDLDDWKLPGPFDDKLPKLFDLPDDGVVRAGKAGRIDGTFEVGHDGAATYRVPIEVPPGRAGLEPQLTLVYSSQIGAQGLPGLGWSIAGLHRIDRCPRRPGVHGVRAGVRFKDDDGLCLDGKPLVLTAGTPARAGAEYRVQEDASLIVVLDGDLVDAGATFRLYRPDGRIVTLGGGQATVVGRQRRVSDAAGAGSAMVGTVTLAWLERRREDRAGNYYTVQYGRNEDPVEVWPEVIRYTGHPDLGDGKRAVVFTYGERARPHTAFVGGVATRASKRLDRIETRAPSVVADEITVRRYYLQHETSTHTGRDLLTELRECDRHGACKPATRFGYSKGSYDYEVVATDVPVQVELLAQATDYLVEAADVDGDLRDDLLVRRVDRDAGRYRLMLHRSGTWSGGSPFGPAAPSGLPEVLAIPGASGPIGAWASALAPVELDHQGGTELLFQNAAGAYAPYRWDAGSGRFTSLAIEASTCGDATWRPWATLVDFDGNGGLDILGRCRETWTVQLQRGDSYLRFAPPTTVLASDATAKFIGGGQDVDGDARGDFLFADDADGPMRRLGLDDAGNFVTEQVNLQVDQHLHHVFLDVNGDGLRDVVLLGGDDVFRVRLNTGLGFGPASRGLPDGVAPLRSYRDRTVADVRVADFNDDGLQDFVVLFERTVPAAPPRLFSGERMVLHVSDGERFTAIDLGHPGTPNMARVQIPVGPPGRWGEDDVSAASWQTTKLLDANGDGLVDIVRLPETGDRLELLRSKGARPDLMTTAVDGMGRFDAVEYSALNAFAYSAEGSCTWPLSCKPDNRSVVRQHSRMHGAFLPTVRYHYRGARTDLTADGWLGFRVREQARLGASETVITRYDADRASAPGWADVPADHLGVRRYPYGRQPVQMTTTVTMPSGQVFVNDQSFVRHAFWRADGKTFGRYLIQAHTAYQERPGAGATPTVKEHRTDSYLWDFETGALSWQHVKSSSGATRLVELEYDHRPGARLFGLVERVTTTHRRGGESRQQVRENGYDGRGLLEHTTLQPDDPELRLHTKLVRNGQGLVEEQIQRDGEGRERVLATFFEDAERMFPTRVRNPEGHEHHTQFDPGLGVPLKVVDENGVSSLVVFDGFGREAGGAAGGGTPFSITWEPRPGTSVGAQIRTRSLDGRESVTVLDQSGRVVEEQVLGFDGAWDHGVQTYDVAGRPVFTSNVVPLAVTPTVGETTTYDPVGRIEAITHADGTVTRLAYDGLTTVVTNPRGFVRRITRDFDDRVRAVDGPGADDLTFTYGALGVREIRDAHGNAWVYGYDDLGRRNLLVDPDTGTHTTERNAFGEIRAVKHSDKFVTYERDRLGRIETVTAAQPDEGTTVTTFVWDEAEHGVGRLARSESPDEVVSTYAYDDFGRVTRETLAVDGRELHLDLGYDDLGRAATITYPEVPGRGRFAVRRSYQRGHLQQVIDAGTGQAIWTLDALDLGGDGRRERFANNVESRRRVDPTTRRLTAITTTRPASGVRPAATLQSFGYKYDEHGNLIDRGDMVKGESWHFTYDQLDRLDTWTRDGALVADYEYDDLGNLRRYEGAVQHYGEDGDGPHLLSNVSCDGVCAPGVVAGDLEHDKLGRRTRDPDGQRYRWTHFDLPSEVTRADGDEIAYRYDAQHRRVLQKSDDLRILSLAGLYEHRTDPTGDRHTMTVIGDTGPVAQVVWVEGGEKRYFLHRERQGSIQLVTDGTGEEVARFAYTPFGKRAGGGDVDDESASFAGHRYDDQVGLVDMGGRVYDPRTGRFLTPDPVVALPPSAQGWNRYSYVLNNPLTLVDPSGFQVETDGSGAGGGSGAGAGPGIGGGGLLIDLLLAGAAPVDGRLLALVAVAERFEQEITDVVSDPMTYVQFLGGLSAGLGADLLDPLADEILGHFGRERAEPTLSYELGYLVGSIIGLVGDIAAMGGGAAMIIGGGAGTVLLALPTGGTVAIPGGAAIAGGLSLAGAGALGGAMHLDRIDRTSESIVRMVRGGGRGDISRDGLFSSGRAPARGDSGRLGRAMERAGFARPPNSEAGHIVPGEAGRVLHDFITRIGMDLNHAWNGIWLPNTYHRGYHAAFNRAMLTHMEEISHMGLTVAEEQAEVERLIEHADFWLDERMPLYSKTSSMSQDELYDMWYYILSWR